MLDKIEYLEDGENRYPIAFTLNVMEAIQEEYETMQKWGELIQNGAEPNIKALKFVLLEMINEGLEIEEKEEELMTSKQVGRLITRIGIKKSSEKVKRLISQSMPEVEKSKNATTTKNPRA